MSSQTKQPPCTGTPSEDASSLAHNFVISTIISLFSSSGPAGDWLKLFVLGGILEVLRRALMFAWKKLVNQFWITLVLEEYNDSYCKSRLSSRHRTTGLKTRNDIAWMMLWLSKHPAWSRAKELSISTHSFGVGARAVLVEGEPDDTSQQRIKFLPCFDCSASLWYRGHYVHLSRTQVPDGPFYMKEVLTVK